MSDNNRTEVSSLGEFGLIDHLTKNNEIKNNFLFIILLIMTSCIGYTKNNDPKL